MGRLLQLDPALAEAVEWTALLRSGTATAEDHARFDAWRHGHPLHDAAASRLEQALAPLGRLREHGVPQAAREAVLRAPRRAALRAIVLGTASLGVGVVAWRSASEAGLLADRSTRIAQREVSTLPGGGVLCLDARTMLDTDFAGGRRVLTLQRGRILAEPMSQPGQPFVVRTPHGAIEADAARLVVELHPGRADCAVLAGRATVAGVPVDAGRRAALVDGAPPQVVAARGTEALWLQGLAGLNDQPLGELVEVLERYRPGVLSIDDAAARLRVSGVFSLDDTERTLDALAQTQPVRVTRYTRYWVRISAA